MEKKMPSRPNGTKSKKEKNQVKKEVKKKSSKETQEFNKGRKGFCFKKTRRPFRNGSEEDTG